MCYIPKYLSHNCESNKRLSREQYSVAKIYSLTFSGQIQVTHEKYERAWTVPVQNISGYAKENHTQRYPGRMSVDHYGQFEQRRVIMTLTPREGPHKGVRKEPLPCQTSASSSAGILQRVYCVEQSTGDQMRGPYHRCRCYKNTVKESPCRITHHLTWDHKKPLVCKSMMEILWERWIESAEFHAHPKCNFWS